MSIKLVNTAGQTLLEINGNIKNYKNKEKLRHHNIEVRSKKHKKPEYMDVISYCRKYKINPAKVYRHLNKFGSMYDEDNNNYIKSLKEESHIL